MNLTVLILIITAIFLALYDVWIIVKEGKGESISAHVIRGSRKYPLLVLLFGILLGHLFWSMSSFDYLPKDKLIEKCKAVINAK
jgi:hypothetical protein